MEGRSRSVKNLGDVGHSRQGRAASKPSHARYAAESGSKFRAASQLMHLVKVARAWRLDFRRPAG